MIVEIIIGALGGLGLFLYGMKLMGTGLQKVAGAKLKRIIELLTSNRITGVLVGMAVTAVIQSSSATTVMVVGFVNAGIMNLTQAIGVIMGANIGTTATAQLISFNFEAMAPLAVGLGMIVYLISNNEKHKEAAEILIGFGILFIGMEFLKNAVAPLREVAAFRHMLVSFGHNTLLGILMGFGLTVIIQSSSASIGILIALASKGLLPLSSALPILYGDNIGTCVTALLSSIGTSKNAKRAALMHLIFNLIGTILFALVLNYPIMKLVMSVDTNVSRQIANAHTLFNLINVVIQLPFAHFLVKIVMKIMPEEENESQHSVTKYLDSRILETPSIALANTVRECLHMGKIAKKSFASSIEGLTTKNMEKTQNTFELEKKINELERAIIEYLIKLSNTNISEENREVVDGLFNTVNDIERIGDHADNIAELAVLMIEKDLPISEDALGDINNMVEKTMTAYEFALNAMKTGDRELALKTLELEDQVDLLERTCRMNHMYRLNKSLCNTESGIIFLDLISNLERISDHASNIARAVLDSTDGKYKLVK